MKILTRTLPALALFSGLTLSMNPVFAHTPESAQASPAMQTFKTYKLERAAALPSTNTGWDYSSLDEKRGLMFIGHRKDGVQVFDVRKGKLIKTLGDSQGANATALSTESNIGIAGTTEGDVVVFELSSLKTIKRYKSMTEGFDGAGYEPFSKRFMMIGTPAKAKQTTPVLFFDGKTGEHVVTIEVQSEKIDPPRSDSAGYVYLPLRDKSSVARIDMRRLEVDTTWTLDECLSPSSLATDPKNQRVFVSCRGSATVAPAMSVLDANSGKQVAKLPIGRGTDDMFFDSHRKTIVVANGDATMNVIVQISADQYKLAQTVSTRPTARSGAFDPSTGKVHLTSAETIVFFDASDKPATTFLPNTFQVLTYGLSSVFVDVPQK